MATFKVCVFRNHLRKDGTYNVKLRITHNCQTRKISTPFYVEEENLSPDLQITDDEHVDLREDLCHECRRITRESGYEINDNDYWRTCPLSHTVDDFMTFIKQGRHSEAQTGCEPKQARAHPTPGPYRYILHACKIKLPEHVVAKMVYGTDVADDV